MKISKQNGAHYRWGQACDGWHLLRQTDVSVIQEKMPPGTSEVRHYHKKARQFFFVLHGEAMIEIDGQRVLLEKHEGLEIAPETPHQVFNESKNDVEFLLISSPPAQGDRVSA